jgi:ABC-type proline/glycine betaine transport system permease subunit
VLAGIPAGAITAWVGRALLEKVDASWMIAVYGGIGGAFAGALLALLLDFIFRRTHAWLEERTKQKALSN